jgi:hypothetical protein
MRGMEVLILAGLLGLVAVAVWNARRWLPEWASPAAPAVAAHGAVAGKPDAKAAAAVGKRKGDRGGRTSLVSNFTLGDLPASKTEVDVPMPGSPFPTRNDLAIGATGVQIRAKYGEPTARVTAMQGGRLIEHYYYVNSDRTQLTVATLERGVVVGVESESR